MAHKKEGREISTPKAATGQCAVCTNHDKALELAEAMEKAIAEDTPPAQRLRNLLAAAHSAGNPSIADVCAILESAKATEALTLRTKGATRPFADKPKAAARFAANSAGLRIGGGTRAQSLWNSAVGLDLASPPGACSCATEPHHQPGSPWWCRKCDAQLDDGLYKMRAHTAEDDARRRSILAADHGALTVEETAEICAGAPPTRKNECMYGANPSLLSGPFVMLSVATARRVSHGFGPPGTPGRCAAALILNRRICSCRGSAFSRRCTLSRP